MKKMTLVLRLEEAGMLLMGFLLFYALGFEWWLFWALLLLPDLSMLGYLLNARAGAFLYNLFHHKGVAVLLLTVGWWGDLQLALMAGIVLFAHASMDRMFGYGLKYSDSFHHTHLGFIGRNASTLKS